MPLIALRWHSNTLYENMQKTFISAQDLLTASYGLALQIAESDFAPDILIGLWRGGAPIAIAVHEFLSASGQECVHFPLRISSYGASTTPQDMNIYGSAHLYRLIKSDTRLLLVDDVVETGGTRRAITENLISHTAISAKNIRMACPYYKPPCMPLGASAQPFIAPPDYYLYSTQNWLVFPHELTGLSAQERLTHKPLSDKARMYLDTHTKPNG